LGAKNISGKMGTNLVLILLSKIFSYVSKNCNFLPSTYKRTTLLTTRVLSPLPTDAADDAPLLVLVTAAAAAIVAIAVAESLWKL